jgi:hypothetical protein
MDRLSCGKTIFFADRLVGHAQRLRRRDQCIGGDERLRTCQPCPCLTRIVRAARVDRRRSVRRIKRLASSRNFLSVLRGSARPSRKRDSSPSTWAWPSRAPPVRPTSGGWRPCAQSVLPRSAPSACVRGWHPLLGWFGRSCTLLPIRERLSLFDLLQIAL